MQKPISDVETRRPPAAADVPMNVVLITLDGHLAGAVDAARIGLRRDLPGVTLSAHVAADWALRPELLEACKRDVAAADLVIVTMLFMEEHLNAILPALKARRDACDAMVAMMSAGEAIKLTRLGRFDMGAKESGALALLKRLRGGGPKASRSPSGKPESSGARQMAMVKRLPKILRFIPGAAQDVRAYFLTMQYWLACSDRNLEHLVRYLVGRYADGPRRVLRTRAKAEPPADYPEIGVYHPSLKTRLAPAGLSARAEPLPAAADAVGAVGVILMRSYLLSGDTAHYDGAIAAIEAAGLRAVPVFASGLDARPAIDRYFLDADGAPTVDAVVSLTGFSLVGGPAYNDADAAATTLAELDVPYIAAHALEFQSLAQWTASERGLTPLEATMMVAIPEIDGATAPMVFGGRRDGAAPAGAARAMAADPERCGRLAARLKRLITLRKTPRAERKIAITLFNFPPNAGATGTAAFLSVFESLLNTLRGLQDAGYDTGALPKTAEDLRALVTGERDDDATARFGLDGALAARMSADAHVRREPHLAEIEAQWGPAPGRTLTDGRDIFVLGKRFGAVFVGLQPGFGYEGDPMRLLFEKGFAPTHAFSAYYRWLREDFGADAVLHFGTHGALEFMPGKQTGLGPECWPERLIGDLPNFYLYAANNPSEGAIAKRRSAATLISYMTPPLAQAGLYKGLSELKASIDRWRARAPEAGAAAADLAALIQAQAGALDLVASAPAWSRDAAPTEIAALSRRLLEIEEALIPEGLHVIGRPPSKAARIRTLSVLAEAEAEAESARREVDDGVADISPAPTAEEIEAALDRGAASDRTAALDRLMTIDKALTANAEISAILHALDGGFIRPAPGGDLIRSPDVLPTGRNLHAFDPFRIPSAFACADGAAQADRLIAAHRAGQGAGRYPESIAMVLWGTDNLKTEGGPIAQALALMGAAPRFDAYGRLSGARLIPLNELGRPRIDVVSTLSGIFRDLLPLQTRMLAEAAYLAAEADEPAEMNFVRKHALARAEALGCSLEDAALRVFSNAEGAYGANVNHLIDSGAWRDEDELADTYQKRKCFAYGRTGAPRAEPKLLESALAEVELSYQNLESVEVGVTDIDHYFDTLGGVGRAVARARGGAAAPVYIGDQTRGEGKIRTLAEQVALEARTRTLNPKWYEAMLAHGYEGVRQIESHVTNTMGWSATTGQVDPWVYKQITATFMLDPEMRERLAALNPKASAKVANRLIEAHERNYWTPDDETLEALRRAGEELEDRLEGAPPAPSDSAAARPVAAA